MDDFGYDPRRNRRTSATRSDTLDENIVSPALDDNPVTPENNTTGSPADTSRGKQLREQFKLLTTEEVADILGYKPETMEYWRATRQGPDYIKAGRNVLYRSKDVVDWLEHNIVVVPRRL